MPTTPRCFRYRHDKHAKCGAEPNDCQSDASGSFEVIIPSGLASAGKSARLAQRHPRVRHRRNRLSRPVSPMATKNDPRQTRARPQPQATVGAGGTRPANRPPIKHPRRHLAKNTASHSGGDRAGQQRGQQQHIKRSQIPGGTTKSCLRHEHDHRRIRAQRNKKGKMPHGSNQILRRKPRVYLILLNSTNVNKRLNPNPKPGTFFHLHFSNQQLGGRWFKILLQPDRQR